VYTAIAAILIESALEAIIYGRPPKVEFLEKAVRVSIIMTLIVSALWEAAYFFKLWRAATEEAVALQAANFKHQISRLKSELNPHFLFNNFNTLAAVIEEDPKRATRMVEALSKYYRYVLKGESHLLSTLEEELESLNAYYFLLQIRHEEAVQLHIDVPATCLALKLPTLTLQTLAENATKHNAVTLANPLILTVKCSEEGEIRVSNNVIPRHGKAPGAGRGLSNLAERCQLLGLGELAIADSPHQFTVSMHLLKADNPISLT
jgi:LytS/YehU family sensor histidine kinase